MAKGKLDLKGQRYGSLTILREAARAQKHGFRKWKCRCDCGSVTVVFQSALRSGITKSCGCARGLANQAREKHGADRRGARTKEYGAWCSIRQRCGNPNNPAYKYYGKRGVKVCERWLASFANFLADMGTAPPDTSIDRINNDGNYEPGNCRWADKITQANNKRQANQWTGPL